MGEVIPIRRGLVYARSPLRTNKVRGLGREAEPVMTTSITITLLRRGQGIMMSHIKLRQMRKDSGKSVTEIAKHLGMTAPAYRRYERGEVDPRISQVQEICRFLNCRIQDIWGEEDVPDHVNVSYTAKPGQTVYVKVNYDDDALYETPVKLRRESQKKKAINGN